MKAYFLTGVLALLCSSHFAFAADPIPSKAYEDTGGEGRALVQDLLTRRPAENTEILGLLKVRPPKGPLLEIPVKMITQLTDSGWEDVYQARPVGKAPGEVLVIKRQGLKGNEYLYGKASTPSLKPELKSVAGEALFQPFARSDFFLADLGLEFLHWPSQKIVKKEMRKSRYCNVVESLNPVPTPGTYSRVLSWLDYDTGNILRAEGYDHNGRLLKEFSVRKISRSKGRAQLKEIEIRNEQTDSRTRLEFNFEMED